MSERHRWATHRGTAAVLGAILLATVALAAPVAVSPPASAGTRLRVLSEQPGNGAQSVSPTAPITIRFSQPIAAGGAMPVILPPVPGKWRRVVRQLIFTPSGAYAPDNIVVVEIPGRADGIHSTSGALLPTDIDFSFLVATGSELRAQQLLAELNYLPVIWRSASHHSLSTAAYELAAFDPPAGRFSYNWDAPRPLRNAFVTGAGSVVMEGAINRFEFVQGLPVDGTLSGPVWSALLGLARHPARNGNPGGYTYGLASKTPPETLKVWQAGHLVVFTPANTGIPLAPTPDGTWPVYARLANQIMKGVDPSGKKYADPVSWVAYFNGSDAVHYIDRSSFGYQQSLGCVEVPLAAAHKAWGYLTIGTLVSVEG